MIADYAIVDGTREQVVEGVRRYIDKGWEPFGSPSICVGPTPGVQYSATERVIQAVVFTSGVPPLS